MEVSVRNGSHEFNLASRKAEEAACRRVQAAKWLISLVGPLGMSEQPSEMEFISCLRNGIVLCNAINKIKPGAVTKVVEIHQPLQSLSWESQPLPAYQYFENVRNFLVAVEELKIPAFEASDIERDSLEAASAAKVVDCVLALKSYHEWKQMSNGKGFYKHVKSPMVMHFANRVHLQTSATTPLEACRRLEGETKQLEDAIVRKLVDCMVYSKENIDNNLLALTRIGKMDPVKLFSKIMSNCLEEHLQNKFAELKPEFGGYVKARNSSPSHQKSMPLEDLTSVGNFKHCRACLRKDNCSHKRLFQLQEKELVDLKDLLKRTKGEFEDLQSQLERDLKDLGNQVQEMSAAALGHQRVVKENRNLHNMVQDLKGNIQVYCRIRPSFSEETRNVIDFVGEDGSLVILDPSKPRKDGRKLFKFNLVFGPSATQDMIFNDTQPLIRSVMYGYNACIFAYGQTGSGKTHTMSGPSDRSLKDTGINYFALNDLFEMSCQRKDFVNYDIHVRMVEIYNEQVRDLLGDSSSTAKLEIPSCPGDNGLALPDHVTVHSVKSATDVLSLIRLGEMNRVVSSTAVNNRSRRSHSVLTVYVCGKDVSGRISRSSLHLVDLAGSERVDESEVTGDRLKEAQCINKSLSCLGDVITALAQKSSHIPYRNSKLTLLLQDLLGGRAKTLMIAHVNPEEDSFEETVSTLKFAQRVSTVELGAARANKPSSEVLQLKEQVERLKKALENKEADARTPPLARRSSLESGNSVKQNKMREPRTPCAATVKTPSLSRRSSMESLSSVRSESIVNKTRESRTPCSLPAKTPPRARRLSIESCSSVKSEKAVNLENRRIPKTPSGPTRTRGLNLEGPGYGKKNSLHIKVPDNQVCAEQVRVVSYEHSNSGSVTMASQRRVVEKEDGRPQDLPIQLPEMPEPQVHTRNEVQIVIKSEITLSAESHTPVLTASANKKVGSQIKKSLRTIGKLITGSEKRSRQKAVMEAQEQAKADTKPPVSANARVQRRQSLTGSQTSRRSSLGEVQPGHYANDSKPPKTPPPAEKRWL